MMTAPQAFALALQHHRAGRLAEAEALCRQILAVQQNHADAWHLLGIIACQAGRHDSAVEALRRAIELDPHNAAAHSNMGEACRAGGRLEEAFASYQRALKLNPNDALVYYNMGIAMSGLGQLDKAVDAYRRALALRPDFAEAHDNLGSALREQGKLDEAVAAHRRALVLRPDYAEAHNNLGIAFRDQGQFDAAIAAYRRALELKPDYAQAHNNLGNGLQEQGQLDEAVECYHRALDLQPDYPEAHNNLGNALRKQDRLEEATAAYQRALKLRPGYAEAHFNFGNACLDQGQTEEAAAAFRRGVELMPGLSAGYSSLLMTLHYLPGLPEGTIVEEQRRWNRRIAEPLQHTLLPHPNDRSPDRRLRVGYVSPNFREHVVGQNLRPLFRCHDHRDFEIFCYSGASPTDHLTEEFRHHADHWRNTVGVSDEALARMIREDGVDILVDLAQHTAGNRLPVFARQPAPVQVSFAGYPASTGLDAITYRISDRYLEAESACSGAPAFRIPHSALRTGERVLLLDSFWCYDPRGAEVDLNALPASINDHVTFGSLSSFCKLNASVLQLWARVLAQAKDSRLILLGGLGSHRQRTIDFLAREGVAENRVEFVERRPRKAYLEIYHRLDIALDPFPYGGHTTSLDALWMGVPLVSLAGQAPVSRGGMSILSNAGLPELVAHSEDDYVRIATELAHDLPRLANLRGTLRSRMENSVLMDAPNFARQIEAAYRTMWRRWCVENSNA